MTNESRANEVSEGAGAKQARRRTGRNASEGRLVEVGHAIAETTFELVDGDEAAPREIGFSAGRSAEAQTQTHLDSRHLVHCVIINSHDSHVRMDWTCQFVPLQRCSSLRVSSALGACRSTVAHLALSASKDPDGELNLVKINSFEVGKAEVYSMTSASPDGAEGAREQKRAKELRGASEVEEVGDGRVQTDLC